MDKRNFFAANSISRLDSAAVALDDSVHVDDVDRDQGQDAMSQVLRQAAVIPMSDGRVCMVTSSSGRRWVIPKGMIDPGHTAGEAALNEAWEEAGLVGVLGHEPAGSYLYEKYGRTHHVLVYVLHVTNMAADWPERDVRKREWVEPGEALERTEETGLREIIESASRGAAVTV